MKRSSALSEKSALVLVEEATHTLRTAPAGTLATYYSGAVPFVVGFLYFWADMSRNPFAGGHVAEAALGITALFLWMKFSQAVFIRRILAQVAGRPIPSSSVRQKLSLFFSQAMIQSTGLFLIPLSLVLVVPFGWVYAFYQTFTALDEGRPSEASRTVRRTWKAASLWPYQNHLTIGVTLLFGICVFLNWLVVCVSIPSLLKMFFGIDSIFARSPLSMLNTTFLSAIAGLTYLSVDPIVKTIYALRSFYGQSVQSGEDLKASLKQFEFTSQYRIAILVIVASLVPVGTAAAQSSTSSVSPAELDRQIDEVIGQTKYAWRMPRVVLEQESQKGVISRFLDSIVDLIRQRMRRVVNWLDSLLRNWLRNQEGGPGGGPFGWVSSSLLYLLLAVALGFLALLLLRLWRRRSPPIVSIRAEAIPYTPDVADENTRADQLPEDGWIRLAHNLLERGEFRLAMRAFYLATLAHLAQQNLIAIARFKSNRDYEAELRRRAHAFPDLLPPFTENMNNFERIWYGVHEVNMEAVYGFAANVERITGLKTMPVP